MDTMSPFSHQHDPDVALYQSDHTDNMLSHSAQWALGLDNTSSNDYNSMSAYAAQPRNPPSYISGSELQPSASSTSPSRHPITASLPMLNPPSKRNRDDELLDSPSLDNETFLRPSDVESNYTYLDPTASFEPKETSQSDGEFDFLDDEAGPMEEGEQVLRLGSPSKAKAKKKGKSNAGAGPAGASSEARQKLLKEDSPDEDGKASGRKKIQIAFIEDKSRRHITFSKRKAGIMKKAYELSTLTGTQVLLLVVSETGTVFTYTTSKLQPLVAEEAGKALIRECLDSTEDDLHTPEPKHGGHVALKTNGKSSSIAKRPSAGNLRAKRSAANLRAAAAAPPALPVPNLQHHQQQQMEDHQRQQSYYFPQQQGIYTNTGEYVRS